MTAISTEFGSYVRSKRTEAGLSLRKLAGIVGISPTYLSQIENANLGPPAPRCIAELATALREPEESLLALAGRLPVDVPEIIQERPEEMTEFLREARGLTTPQLKRLTNQARRLKRTPPGQL